MVRCCTSICDGIIWCTTIMYVVNFRKSVQLAQWRREMTQMTQSSGVGQGRAQNYPLSQFHQKIVENTKVKSSHNRLSSGTKHPHCAKFRNTHAVLCLYEDSPFALGKRHVQWCTAHCLNVLSFSTSVWRSISGCDSRYFEVSRMENHISILREC